MNYWFTADTHFYHANIIKYSNRPFKDSVEMTETIIRNWNNRVEKDDLIYHLGDFVFGGDDIFARLINRLNGLIVLVKGNHDKTAWKNRNKFYAFSDSYREIEIDGQKITLCHYAMRVWNRSHRNAWHLYGHSHGSLPDDPHSLSIDVGVDCHNYAPINFEQVKKIMSKKYYTPIDHHGKLNDKGELGLNPTEYAKLERKRMFEQLKKEFNGN